MSRVLIVNMPFSNLRWPNLGPSLLKAALAQRGIGCDIAYFNFDFAERIGLDDYYWIADSFGFVLGGERLFAKHYFDGQLPDDESYYREVLLASDAGLSAEEHRDYEQLQQHVAPFLDHCAAAIDWSGYDVAGFAATFQQTMPSLCLARRIKQIRPQTTIVFGGAACEGPMGLELLRQFPLVDYVFLGEADLTFPWLVEQILGGKVVELAPGVAGRQAPAGQRCPTCCDVGREPAPGSQQPPPGTSVQAIAAPGSAGQATDTSSLLPANLDELPYPDFDDYFQRLRRSPLAGQVEPLLFFETSRGCWWGQKHHCVFCGLNGSTLAFRSKSPRRAVEELRYLTQRYDLRRACSSDNILDYRYFDTFLPMLKEARLGLAFVFEMKTNLTRAQVTALLEAGLGAAQLGIETFSTSILRLIGKGATALHNLQTLKWFSEAGIEVKWNLLWGFPTEDPQQYAALAELLPSLYHLAPPLAAGRVRMDRFAPYFENPLVHGMTGARPNRAFRYVYPFPEDSLARLAYYFEFDYLDGRNPLDYAAPVLEAVATWQQLKGTVTLRCWDRSDGVLILHDTRPCATAFQRRLRGLPRQIYLFCDTGRSLQKILQFAAAHANGAPHDEAAVRRIIEPWVDERIMVRLDDRYLSLALRAPADVTA